MTTETTRPLNDYLISFNFGEDVIFMAPSATEVKEVVEHGLKYPRKIVKIKDVPKTEASGLRELPGIKARMLINQLTQYSSMEFDDKEAIRGELFGIIEELENQADTPGIKV